MLKRVRIEVEGEESAAAASTALDRYEYALLRLEGERYLGFDTKVYLSNEETREPREAFYPGKRWVSLMAPDEVPRTFGNPLGREVTDEVIEFNGEDGYTGRRVVKFTRLDTRTLRGHDPQMEIHSGVCSCGPNEGCTDCPK